MHILKHIVESYLTSLLDENAIYAVYRDHGDWPSSSIRMIASLDDPELIAVRAIIHNSRKYR